MLQRWLTYVLLVLIAMQSVTAGADMYQNHQAGTKHVNAATEYNQQQANVLSSDRLHGDGLNNHQLNNGVDAEADVCCQCHHCFHCHCTMNHALLKTFSFYISFMKVSVQSRYLNILPTSLITTFYRPPKA